MARLADSVAVRGRFARSANLERDRDRPEPLDGYVLTSRGTDMVKRIASAAADGPAGGAWTVTGPYGSGKSSLALLLDAAFGGHGEMQRRALELIDATSPETGELLRHAHERHGTTHSGFRRGLVTAQREPLTHTVARALRSAAAQNTPTPPPQDWSLDAGDLTEPGARDLAADELQELDGATPSVLVAAARRLATESPLLLVIDEFGKNLEAIRDGGDTDPYLLQQLAEAGQGSGLPIFVLTLQHLSFEDCLTGVDGTQRREWAKVQGRFEDVAFVESATQTRSLIGTVFDIHDGALQARIGRWANKHAQAMQALGIAELADRRVVAACYPLHPLAALVLPELCNRHGQHERTLFSFLAGSHPTGAAAFLEATRLPSRGALPSLGLDAVYDYFVGSGALNITSARHSSRWTEVATRLRDARGLTGVQARTAKAVALLNLVSTSGTVRASRRLLELAGRGTAAALTELAATGIVTYRDFADEYRVWHGSDVDLGVRVDAARQRIQSQPLVEIVAEIDRLEPMVAARHSALHDVLRVFARRYAAAGEKVTPAEPLSPYDGTVLLITEPSGELPRVAERSFGVSSKPVVAAIPADVSTLDVAAREVAALASVLDDPVVAADRVALRELSERLAQARSRFDAAVSATFGAEACRWMLLNAHEISPADGDSQPQVEVDGPTGGEHGGRVEAADAGERDVKQAETSGGVGAVELTSGRGSFAVSEAAESAYGSTPSIGNEMLNRSELTSQGAKARRLLLEAMIDRGEDEDTDLGFEGHGPEMAMYRAFLARTGLHRAARDGNAAGFGPPTDKTLGRAWRILEQQFHRSTRQRVSLAHINAALQSPPVGMKAAVVPVFVTAGLLTFRDEVAIYEHGTFTPVLSPEVSERMVRNPAHFDVKHFANTSGARLQVVEALAERLGLAGAATRRGARQRRVANVLAVVSALVTRIRRLDNFTLRTRKLDADVLGVRDALAAAVEPDELLFTALPEALGFDPVPAGAAECDDASDLGDAVCAALEELESCQARLLDDLLHRLLDSCGASSHHAVIVEAASVGAQVLDPDVRAFVLALGNDGADSDSAWMAAVATVVARKAPAEWGDDDRSRFLVELRERLAAFHRLVALHADRRADGGGPFDALRVTVTRPDGSEYIRLVGIDERRRPELEAALDETVEAMAAHAGSAQRAEQSLLALLSERLLGGNESSEPAARPQRAATVPERVADPAAPASLGAPRVTPASLRPSPATHASAPSATSDTGSARSAANG